MGCGSECGCGHNMEMDQKKKHAHADAHAHGHGGCCMDEPKDKKEMKEDSCCDSGRCC